MSSKLPRTRENYPNQRIQISGKIFTEAMDFIQEFHWSQRETVSSVVYYIFCYMLKNKANFIKFYKENKDKEI